MRAAEWMVRRALAADLKSIVATERECAEAPHWSEGVWLGVLAEEEGSESPRGSFVAEGGDVILGFAVVSCSCGVAELESVAVAERARRKGLGRALCRVAIDWAQRRAVEVIELEVRASSVGALALYGSLGFRETGVRRGYYSDPMEDAVLMSASLRE